MLLPLIVLILPYGCCLFTSLFLLLKPNLLEVRGYFLAHRRHSSNAYWIDLGHINLASSVSNLFPQGAAVSGIPSLESYCFLIQHCCFSSNTPGGCRAFHGMWDLEGPPETLQTFSLFTREEIKVQREKKNDSPRITQLISDKSRTRAWKLWLQIGDLLITCSSNSPMLAMKSSGSLW